MAYENWISVHITNHTRDKIVKVQNAEFYKTGDKDHEISAANVNETTVAIGGSADVSSCGRQDSPSGATGSIELWDNENKICKIVWDCPWGSQPNKFAVVDPHEDYWVQYDGWNRDGAGIGTVNVGIGFHG
ncbi:hypothetical protein AARAC_004777 [Aspergillus arachidicola]|uniref:Asp-hemolysin n=1 Tax=Aspergillus arachidicola TaxID=656916 RepID=A0A2G7FIC2_9EURO|nr:hypothetical protein AARAC_004777 [Aspergillus arachidicola]